MRKTLLTLTALCATLLAPLAMQTPLAQTVPAVAATVTARVIVKYKADSATGRMHALSANAVGTTAQHTAQAAALGQRLGLALRAGAAVAERSHVVFASGMTSAQLAQKLAADADVEYAVPDERRHALAAPNDLYYPAGVDVGQWYLRPNAGVVKSSIDAEPAWAITTGSNSIVVAVLDSGVLFNHQDLQKVANGGNLLDGYDMINDPETAADGNGRDANASDPGDALSQADINSGNFPDCTSADVGASSWHGTGTAALIGAVTNNGIGMASVGRNLLVLPVRVLGKCGGSDSDIIAAMRWAAGLSTGDPSVPANSNRAKVINLSLGGVGACTQAYRDAINDITLAGTVVVASAGNDIGHAVATPANCPGVIAVSGLRQVGSKVGYSNLGPEATIAAPGGNCVNNSGSCVYGILTAGNSGFITPAGDNYVFGTGTSYSAPLVAGTVGLMLSVDPTLTPLQTKLILQGTARPFPTTGATNNDGSRVPECTAPQYDSAGKRVDQDQCYCTTGTCGAGMLDAGAAVLETRSNGIGNGVQARIDVDSRSAQVGRSLQLSGANSIAQAGVGVASYLWTIVDSGGNVVTQFDSGNTTATGATASVTPRATGRFVVTLEATDGQSVSSTTRLAIVVGSTASLDNGDGGGGALGAGWLALLLVAVLALRAGPRRA